MSKHHSRRRESAPWRAAASAIGPCVALLASSIVLWTGCGSGAGSSAGGSDGRPNILVISIDTCRADALGCYSGSGSTPTLDALAEVGVRFENALAPVPTTMPSHSTMLTGTTPPFHGVHDNSDYRLGESNVTLAELARDQGYATGAVVGSYILDSQYGLGQGFASYDDELGDADNSLGIVERRGEEVSRAAIEWLDSENGPGSDTPFFLFVHYYDAHQAYDPPAPFRPASDDARALYAGEVSYVDHCIGLIFERLEELELFDSTLVIVTSDHGELFGEHGEMSHGYFVYQGALRVPLIFKLPHERTGRTLADRVGLVDIVPSVCGLLGWTAPADVHGVDLSERLRGEEGAAAERFVYCESLTPTLYDASPLLGLVGERWKYIHTARPELYDLESDPGERRDLARTETARAAAMRGELSRVLSEQHRVLGERAAPDEAELAKLKALGYTGGSVREAFDLDAMEGGDDPKDLISFSESDQLLNRMLHEQRIDEARELGERLLSERPGSIHTLLQMTWVARQLGERKAAVDYAARLVAIDPEHARGHFALARACQEAGDGERARKHYERVLEIWPDDAKAHANLGALLLEAERFAAAEEHLRAALASEPKLETAHMYLGRALAGSGDPQGALAQYQLELRHHGDSALVHYFAGLSLQELGQPDQALAAYRRALELDPNLAVAAEQIPVALAATGEIGSAIDTYRELVRQHPERTENHVQLGVMLGMNGDLDGAIASFESALAVDADLPEANAQLGVALRMKGRLDESIRYLSKAVAARGDDTNIVFALGRAYEENGQPDRAAAQYRRVLELAPGEPTATEALSRVAP